MFAWRLRLLVVPLKDDEPRDREGTQSQGEELIGFAFGLYMPVIPICLHPTLDQAQLHGLYNATMLPQNGRDSERKRQHLGQHTVRLAYKILITILYSHNYCHNTVQL